MTDKQFVNGATVKKITGKYGDFYSLGINISDFCEKNPINERGWINFNLFHSKDGKPYLIISEDKIKE